MFVANATARPAQPVRSTVRDRDGRRERRPAAREVRARSTARWGGRLTGIRVTGHDGGDDTASAPNTPRIDPPPRSTDDPAARRSSGSGRSPGPRSRRPSRSTATSWASTRSTRSPTRSGSAPPTGRRSTSTGRATPTTTSSERARSSGWSSTTSTRRGRRWSRPGSSSSASRSAPATRSGTTTAAPDGSVYEIMGRVAADG